MGKPNWNQIAAVTKHGYTSIRATPEQRRTYAAWEGMIGRCYQKNRKEYHRYGGRGITVCERWRNSFKAFSEDMGPIPSSRHSIDRWPNKNGNYEKSNCRWANRKQQQNNMRSNALVRIDGEEMTTQEAAEKFGLGAGTIRRLAVNGEIARDRISAALSMKRPLKYQPRMIVFRGQSMNLNQCSSTVGMSTALLYYRVVKLGMAVEDAIALPIKKVK